ncbi:MAG: hypothetical protein VX877_03560 [Planctomycetota bacterium]|nr:hypothetical protein [Planctomycetota bacterium]
MKKTLVRTWPLAVLILAVVLWHWPATLMGRVPGEGMVSLGDLPLFSFLGRAFESGRVPLWNELAGFGSPVLAEGQIGVLYPPHRLLFGLFDAPTAFVVSLVLHTVLAGSLTYCCARGLGQSRAASLMAGLIFCGQGFFMARTDFVWASTTACWLPLAVLATWRWMQDGGWVWPVTLAGVLGLQLLAGHFQVAFFTLVIVLVITAILGVRNVTTSTHRFWSSAGRGGLVLLAITCGISLAAAQLAPTAELLMRADLRGRGTAYLQSHSLPPAHLFVNHLAPGTLAGYAAAEPLAWVPFRSSSRESLCYVGLLPWMLAIWALVACRQDRDVKLLGGLLTLTLLFSMGRFVPGSTWLLGLPGFDWFAAPARWSVASGLCWALLAGRGLDQMPHATIQRWSGRLGLAIPILVVTGLVAISLTAVENGGTADKLARVFSQFRTMLPGLIPLALNLAMLGLLSCGALYGVLSHRQRWLALALVWVAVDLGWTGGLLRAMTWEPRANPVEQSPVLASLANHPEQRTAGSFGNSPMTLGIANFTNDGTADINQFWDNWVPPYEHLWRKTLATIPSATRWNDMAVRLQSSPGHMDRDDIEFLRLADIRRLYGVFDSERFDKDFPLRASETIRDEWMTRQYFGSFLASTFLPDSTWLLWKLDDKVVSARAWLFPIATPPEAGTDPRLYLRPPPARRLMLDSQPAVPLTDLTDRGETVVVRGTASSKSVLVLSDLEYPGWEAMLTIAGESSRVPIAPAFGGWKSVEIPTPGQFELTFSFRPPIYRVGTTVSLAALFVWLILLVTTTWHHVRLTRHPA